MKRVPKKPTNASNFMRSIGSATENERPYLPGEYSREITLFFHDFSILRREQQEKKRTKQRRIEPCYKCKNV